MVEEFLLGTVACMVRVARDIGCFHTCRDRLPSWAVYLYLVGLIPLVRSLSTIIIPTKYYPIPRMIYPRLSTVNTVLIGEEDSMVNKIVPANKIVWFVHWLRHCRESLDKIV